MGGSCQLQQRPDSSSRRQVDGPFEVKKSSAASPSTSSRPRAEMDWAMRFMKLHLEHWPAWEGECEVRAMFSEGDGPKTK